MAEKRKKFGGRPKGSKNKTPTFVKECLLAAFDDLGGIDAFVRWGTDNPSEFYKLWGRLVPHEINAKHTGNVDVRVSERIITTREEARALLPVPETNGVHRQPSDV